MAKNWWDDLPDAPGAKPTVQEREKEAGIVQSGASAESATATAAKTRALLPADVRKALADAEAAEAKNKTEAADRARAKDAKQFALTEDTDNMLSALARARAVVGSGGWGQAFRGIPETDAKTLFAMLGPEGPVASFNMIERMKELKAQSPTGSTGFGQQSNAEGAALRNSIDSLDLGRKPEEILDTINRIERHYRRMAAFTRGENPDEEETAVRYGLMPAETDDGLAPTEVASPGEAAVRTIDPTGKARSEGIGALKGLNGVVDSMLKGGRTADQIRAYIDTIVPGLGEKATGLEQAEAYYKLPANQRKKDGSPIVNLESVDKENGWLGQLIGKAAASPLGAGVVGSADTLTSGLLDDAVGAMGGNADAAKMNMKAVEMAHPNAYFAGQMVGGLEQALIPGAAGMGGLAAKYGLGAGKLGALQGGAYGWGSSDETGAAALLDAGLGAGLGAAGGKVGEAIGRGVGRTVRGIADTVPTAGGGTKANPARYLNEQGVPMTIGEILGGGVRGIENFAGRMPIIKNLVGNRLDEGMVGYNQAGMRQSLEGLETKYQTASGEISDAGIRQAKKIASSAFDDVLKPLRLKPDADYATRVQLALAELEDVDPSIRNAVEKPLRNLLKDTTVTGSKHVITGEDFQAALRTVQNVSNAYAEGNQFSPLYKDTLKPQFDALDDAFRGLVERQAPDALPKYDAAREAYRKVNILQDATKRADLSPGPTRVVPDANRAFEPKELEAAGQANATTYTGRNSGVDRGYPLEPLARAGQDVLTPRPASGGPFSALYGALPPSIIGGSLYGLQPGATRNPATGEVSGGRDATLPILAALGGTAALAGPYSSGARNKLQQLFMAERSPGMASLGDLLLKYAPRALQGAGATAPTSIKFAGLPAALPTPNDASSMLPLPLEQAPTEEMDITVETPDGERIPLPPGAWYDPKSDEIVSATGARVKRTALTAR